METKKKILLILVLAFGLIVCLPKAGSAAPMGTAWTYQGRLMDANVPADGLYDLQFKLYDVNVAGTQKGSTIDVNELDVIDGQFTILLDFGSDVFNGDDRWLQIGVRPGVQKDPNEYTTLSPRQKVTPTPYALQTRGIFVDSSGNVGIGETNPASKLVVGQSGDILLKAAGEDAGDIIFANSTGTQKGRIYTAPEAGQNKLYLTSGDNIADITIDPIGNVGIGKTNPTAKLDVNGDISAASNYKIGGNTVLSVPGIQNTFVGVGAGPITTGNYNTFSGYLAGYSNTTGNSNTFLGYQTGYSNTTGWQNTFSGYQAGYSNTEGTSNTFSGYRAGYSNTTGYSNTFSGAWAGYVTTGNYNTFLGRNAGYSNTTGSGNVFIGYGAGYGVNVSNKLYIANSSANPPLIYGDFSTGNVGIGTTTLDAKITVQNGASGGIGVHGKATNTGNTRNYGGLFEAWGVEGQGVRGVGGSNGVGVYGGSPNTGVCGESGGSNGRGVSGYSSNNSAGAINYGGYFEATNISSYGVYGKSDTPGGFGVYGYGGDYGYGVAARGGHDGYDFYADGPGRDYGTASSIRWKSDIRPIDEALGKVMNLRGVYFNWDAEHGGQHDVGMVAEEVGKVLPEIVGYEENGIDATGMDYGKLAPLLVEAVKALKTEIDQLQKENADLRNRVEAMEKMMTGGSGLQIGVK